MRMDGGGGEGLVGHATRFIAKRVVSQLGARAEPIDPDLSLTEGSSFCIVSIDERGRRFAINIYI